MLTPDYLEYCADDIVELYSQLDEMIIRDIARRIVKTGDIAETARWQIEKVQQGGLLYEDVIAEIAKITDASENHVKTLFEDAGIASVEYDNAIYEKAGLIPPPTRMSQAAYQVLIAGAAKTSGNLKNLTMTTANTAQNAYINACTLAEMQIESGAFNYQTAIRNAVREAAKRGNTVLYPSGHIDRLDVAVRRAVLTGVSQTTGQVALQNAKDMDCDLMEITAHSGARPSHAVWQGQIVSLSGRRGYLSLDDIGYGTGAGFKGWNCRHDWFPYFEGISERVYTDSDLQALENETVTYNDKTYTEYEATQVQRAMEREIRSTRRQLAALDELVQNGDTAAKAEFDSLSVRLKSQEAKLKDFCYSTDRRIDSFRIQTGGFGRSVSQKAVWANKKSVANLGSSDIIELQKFNSVADPMYEVTGSAYDSNPKEIQAMIEQLNQWGVSVNYGSSTLGYGCIRRGEPGVMSITKEASYSAWCHEFQHAKDDKEAGWNGLMVLWTDPNERELRERRAYAIEISLAKKANRTDIVERLEANLNEEIRKIWAEFEN